MILSWNWMFYFYIDNKQLVTNVSCPLCLYFCCGWWNSSKNCCCCSHRGRRNAVTLASACDNRITSLLIVVVAVAAAVCLSLIYLHLFCVNLFLFAFVGRRLDFLIAVYVCFAFCQLCLFCDDTLCSHCYCNWALMRSIALVQPSVRAAT